MARLGSLLGSFAAVLLCVAGCSGNADELNAAKDGKKTKPTGTAAPPGGEVPYSPTPGGPIATPPTVPGQPIPGQVPTGSCAPTQITSMPSTLWRPPNQLHRQLCTGNEAVNIVNCYVGRSAAACDAQVTAGCHDCLVSEVNDAAWGPLVYDTARQRVEHNVEGCVAALSGDISANGCGARMRVAEQCKMQACANCTNPAQLPTCMAAAGTTGTCAQYENAAKACSAQFLAQCKPTTDPIQLGQTLARAFCM